MAEGQKKRQVGKGMKPRGNKRFKPQKETRAMVEKVTNEGQVQGAPEPVLEPKVRNETPGNLEPENGSELLQNLEQKEAIVAQDEGEKMSEVRFFSDSSELEAALNGSGSGSISDEEALERGIVVERDSAGIISSAHPVSVALVDLEAAMAEGTGTVKKLEPPCGGIPMGSVKPEEMTEAHAGAITRAFRGSKYSVGVDYGMGEDKSMMAVIKHGGDNLPDELLATFGLVSIGPQSDGSEKFIITIQEGYTDAVRQWAEADGVPVEQWLSDRLYEYVSTYGEPAKGR